VRFFLRLLDWLAIAVLVILATAGCGLGLYGLFVLARGILEYLTSRDGEGVAVGLIFAAIVSASIGWLNWRRGRRDLGRCIVCDKPAAVHDPQAGWLCRFHGRGR
jgi:hypothetical protein